MNVASLELCQELFKLSGWDNTTLFHVPPNRSNNRHHVSMYKGIKQRLPNREWFPAYDLGYLLRKLPNDGINIGCAGEAQEWRAAYLGVSWYAQTPEDATCQLAIELFKQGVLPDGREITE